MCTGANRKGVLWDLKIDYAESWNLESDGMRFNAKFSLGFLSFWVI